MRRIFAKWLLDEFRDDKHGDLILLTADMGYGLWDDIRKEFPDRFVNCGSSEQLMLGMAAGYAMEGKVPICYSISSFLLYRPFEFIRNYMHIEGFPIKLVGGGRDKDYGYLGYTHWADDDEKVLAALPKIQVYKPIDEETLNTSFHEFLYSKEPAYLNLKK